jgi:hypothetical protein
LSGDRDKELGTHSATFRRCEVVLIKLHLQVSDSPPEYSTFALDPSDFT